MREADIQADIRVALSQYGARAFNNSVGMAYTEDGRVVKYGLCKGSSDLIGWVPIEITEDMVGKTVAVFLANEVKGPKGRPTKEQLNFIQAVTQSGGIAAVVRSEGEAIEGIETWKAQISK